MNPDLIVRLPNHLGDACMSLPALDLLATRYTLTLLGRSWATDLFAAYPWRVEHLPESRRRRVNMLRARFLNGTNALLLTNSFGSALDFWLADLRVTGYRTDLRGLLLWQPVNVPKRWHRRAEPPMHMVEYYYALACTLVEEGVPVPPRLALRLSPEAVTRAQEMLTAVEVGSDFVVLCPIAIGRHRGKVKAWSGFGELCRALLDEGRAVVACPGPGESEAVRQALPGAKVLAEVDVGTFAALLAASRLVVANDSGAAHVAAAVGAHLVTLFGVTDARRTGPWSPTAVGVGSAAGWPSLDEVTDAVRRQLDAS